MKNLDFKGVYRMTYEFKQRFALLKANKVYANQEELDKDFEEFEPLFDKLKEIDSDAFNCAERAVKMLYEQD